MSCVWSNGKLTRVATTTLQSLTRLLECGFPHPNRDSSDCQQVGAEAESQPQPEVFDFELIRANRLEIQSTVYRYLFNHWLSEGYIVAQQLRQRLQFANSISERRRYVISVKLC